MVLETFKMFKVTYGVSQGGHLPPILFSLFINIYDAKLFAWVTLFNDCDIFQSSINSFVI